MFSDYNKCVFNFQNGTFTILWMLTAFCVYECDKPVCELNIVVQYNAHERKKTS